LEPFELGGGGGGNGGGGGIESPDNVCVVCCVCCISFFLDTGVEVLKEELTGKEEVEEEEEDDEDVVGVDGGGGILPEEPKDAKVWDIGSGSFLRGWAGIGGGRVTIREERGEPEPEFEIFL